MKKTLLTIMGTIMVTVCVMTIGCNSKIAEVKNSYEAELESTVAEYEERIELVTNERNEVILENGELRLQVEDLTVRNKSLANEKINAVCDEIAMRHKYTALEEQVGNTTVVNESETTVEEESDTYTFVEHVKNAIEKIK